MLEIICANARNIPLPDESVQCVVTSPPYWGLRKYKGEQELIWGGDANCVHEFSGEDISDVREESIAGKSRTTERFYGEESRKFNGNHQKHFQTHTCVCGAWRGAYGLEPTVEMYVAHTIEILREIRRVLRKDGVVFWNIGDSYCSTAPGTMGDKLNQRGILSGVSDNCAESRRKFRPLTPEGLKPKDLCLIPERVALAAQADGWWVRSRIIWAKPNPMPESVTDRPTDATEHIWLFAKSERYFWDAEAVREPQTGNAHSRGTESGNAAYQEARDSYYGFRSPSLEVPGGRNLRNVWTFATQPYSGAHFATFPEELPRKAILAATSARGACVKCGEPWKRIVRRPPIPEEMFNKARDIDDENVKMSPLHRSGKASGQKMQNWLDENPYKTVGWEPTCKCGCDETRPCLVLDPFGGSGTTGRVAIELNRRAVLLDLAYADKDGAGEYATLARKRTTGVQRQIF